MEALIVLGVLGLVALLSGVRVYREYERGVIFRFGRARKALASPGFNLLLPFGMDRMRVVDIRTRARPAPAPPCRPGARIAAC